MSSPVKLANISSLFWSGIVLCLFGIFLGHIRLWSESGTVIVPSGTYVTFLSLPLILFSLFKSKGQFKLLQPNLGVLSSAIFFIFLSDWLVRSYNLFQGPSIRGEILLMSLVFFFLLKKGFNWIFPFVTLGTIALLFLCFYLEGNGALLFSDDHATFFYRLSLLKEEFPRIPFYYPFWNGGIDQRDFFATGALNSFFLFWPLLKFFEVKDVYNLVVGLILFVLPPSSLYLSAKIQRLSHPAPWIAALLGLGNSLLWYRWGLKYGTLGFVISASLVPLNLSLICKLFSDKENLSKWEAFLFVITTTLMLFWSASGLVFIPAACIGIWKFFTSDLGSKKYVLSIGLAIIIFNLPWMSMFWSVSNISGFLHFEKAPHVSKLEGEGELHKDIKDPPWFRHKAGGINLHKSLKVLRETLISTHPLLVFLPIYGIFFMPTGSRLISLVTYSWLFILGTLVVPIKPQLEFDRMLIILFLCFTIPASWSLLEIFRLLREQTRLFSFNNITTSICGGFLFVTPWVSASIVLNRTLEQYYFKSPVVNDLQSLLDACEGGGRVLFTGCVVHQLSGGHLAPLALGRKTPLMASSPFHTLWRYTQPIPTSFLKRKDEGIEDYFNTYNVTSVIAHEPYWREYFLSKADKYKLMWRGGGFNMFDRVDYVSNYFLEGQGEILAQTNNSIVLKPGTKDVVLKFNYFPFLRSTGCEISEVSVAQEVNFIKLSGCEDNKEVRISSVSPMERVWGGG